MSEEKKLSLKEEQFLKEADEMKKALRPEVVEEVKEEAEEE